MIKNFEKYKLLESKIDNSNIDDVLIVGVNTRDIDIIDLALKKGAKFKTELIIHAIRGDVNFFEKIVDRIDKKQLKALTNSIHIGRIIYNLLKRDKKKYEKWTEQNLDIDFNSDVGVKTIAAAIQDGNLDMVRYLYEELGCPLDPDKKSKFKKSSGYRGTKFMTESIPIAVAANFSTRSAKHQEILNYILEQDVDVDIFDGEILKIISKSINYGTAIILLKKGVKLTDEMVKQLTRGCGPRQVYNPATRKYEMQSATKIIPDELIEILIKRDPAVIKELEKCMTAEQRKDYDMYIKLGSDFDIFEDD